MTAPAWLWIVFTIVGATGQAFRNAAQRSLIDTVGTVGATHVRFLFGLPFGLFALAMVYFIAGSLPMPTPVSLAWTLMGAVTQILATGLMLAAMRERSFVVTIAYIKTEPIQVALFALVFLGERISWPVAAAILIATGGVLLISWPNRAGREVFSWRPAILGLVSGAFFALSAIGFRGGIVAMASPDYVAAATLTLAISLALQTAILTAWLIVRRPEVMRAILGAWRQSLAAGFLGAFASEMWFLAFALQSPARVRILGLVEVVVAGLLSRRMFAQTPGARDIVGIALIVAGIALVVSA
ncbi:MAG TPA: DMT family transporter [Bauldia sp.]|nr:DMT family transporter [Bauldia sp.]